MCKANDVVAVDVLLLFQEEGSRGGLYVDLDTHWNSAGHALAAQALAPVLEAALERRGK